MNVKMKHLMTALIASAAVSQAVHAQEAPSAVAQDTKQVELLFDRRPLFFELVFISSSVLRPLFAFFAEGSNGI